MLYADKRLWNVARKTILGVVLAILAGRGGAQITAQPPLTTMETPRLRMETGGHIGAVHSLLFTGNAAHPENVSLISCGADKVARVHKLAQDDADALRFQIGEGTGGQFYAAALNPMQPNQLALGSSGGDIKADSDILLTDINTGKLLVDGATGKTIGRLTGHKDTITGLAYSPDGSLLASCGADGRLLLWNFNIPVKTAGKTTGKTAARTKAPASAGTISPTAALMFGKPTSQPLIDKGEYMSGVAFASNGGYLAATSWRLEDDEHRGVLRIWQVDAAHHLTLSHTFEWGSDVLCVAWARPSTRYPQGLLAYGSEDGVIHLRDPGQKFAEQPPLTIPNDSITCLAFNNDGTRLLSGSGSRGHDVTVRVWSLENNSQIQVFAQHVTTVYSVAFAPDGKTAASGDAFGMVYLWNAENGKQIRAFKGPGNPVFTVAWLDGNRVAWGNTYGRERLEHAFDLSAGNPVPRFKAQLSGGTRAQYTWTAAAHPTPGKNKPVPFMVLSALPDDSGVIVRDGKGRETQRIKLGITDHLRCFSFLPNGKVAVGSDLDLAVYNVSGRYVHREVSFEGHEGPVLALAVDPTGQYLLSGGVDQTVRLWSLKDAERARSTRPEDMGAASPNGASGSPVTANGANSANGNGADANKPRLTAQSRAIQQLDESNLAMPRPQPKPAPAITSLLGIFEGDGGVWVAWAQNGYYAASPSGEDVLGWHINQGADRPAEFLTSYRCPQFYQPQVIAQVWQKGDLNRALAAVFPNNSRPDLNTPLPVQIADVPILEAATVWVGDNQLEPDATGVYHTDAKQVSLKCAFRPSSSPINAQTALNHADGKSLDFVIRKSLDFVIRKNVGPESSNGRPVEQTLSVPNLDAGLNTIRIYAQNDSGISDNSVRVERKASALPQTLRVLAVGISEYNDPDLRLQYADKDALDIQNFFQSNVQTGGNKLFDKVETVGVFNKDATRKNIESKMEDLLKDEKPEDTVLLYFSCHGFDAEGTEGKTYYLAPADVAVKHTQGGRNTIQNGYAWKDILARLANVKAKHIIVMVDHCFAGGVSETLNDPRFLLDNEDFKDQNKTLRELRQNNILVFTASAATEYSYEDKNRQHGAFTASVLDALQGKMDAVLYPNDYAMLNALDFWVPQQVTANFSSQHPALFALPNADKAVPLAVIRH